MTNPKPAFLTLAQNGATPPNFSVPGSSAESGSTLAPGGPTQGGTQSSQPGGFNPFILIGVLLVMMLLMTSLSSRRERKKRATLMSALKKHDRVQTSSGIIGTVVEMNPDDVILRVDESTNTRIRFARAAISSIIKPAKDAADSKGDLEPKPAAKSLTS